MNRTGKGVGSDGLAGANIPYLTRILAVADVFDALASSRPYRPAIALGQCLEILLDMAREGGLDRELVAAFCAEPAIPLENQGQQPSGRALLRRSDAPLRIGKPSLIILMPKISSSAASACSPGTGSLTFARTSAIPFVLGHALAVKHIHGGKAKSDKIDALQQSAVYERSRYQPAVSRPGARQQDYFFYTANNVHQAQVPIYNCPADPTLRPGIDPVKKYAPSSYAANYLVFGNVDDNYANRNAQGKPRLAVSFPDGTSQTILFAEKFASAWLTAPAGAGEKLKGGCYWAYFQADCYNPMFGYYEPSRRNLPSHTAVNAVVWRFRSWTGHAHSCGESGHRSASKTSNEWRSCGRHRGVKKNLRISDGSVPPYRLTQARCFSRRTCILDQSANDRSLNWSRPSIPWRLNKETESRWTVCGRSLKHCFTQPTNSRRSRNEPG